MKAILYETFGELPRLQTVPDPTPPDDGVVVQVEANGICRSDWHGWMGHDSDVHLPHVPGHELAGVVVAVGSQVRRRSVGERVTVPFAVGCGICPECLGGNQHICPRLLSARFYRLGVVCRICGVAPCRRQPGGAAGCAKFCGHGQPRLSICDGVSGGGGAGTRAPGANGWRFTAAAGWGFPRS